MAALLVDSSLFFGGLAIAAIYVADGLLVLMLGAYVLLRGRLHLPMPRQRAGGVPGH